ncbi:MAG: hypothetical protein NT069_31420 [Planctomycetota bacterium]|nr:hypothetical protein [Planctomycetota bacterium]
MTNKEFEPTTGEKLLDVRCVRQLLNCSERHIWRMADRGLMPRPRKLGALCRWPLTELEDWIAAGCPRVRSIETGGAK